MVGCSYASRTFWSNREFGSNPVCWSPLCPAWLFTAVSQLREYKVGINRGSKVPQSDWLIKRLSVVCTVCLHRVSSSLSSAGSLDRNQDSVIPPWQFCYGLQNALVGVEGSVAAVLCSSMCVWDEEGVLPQDRGGVLELCSKWNEHHSKPHTAGGWVSTSSTASLLCWTWSFSPKTPEFIQTAAAL